MTRPADPRFGALPALTRRPLLVAMMLLAASACGDSAVTGVVVPSANRPAPSGPNLQLAAARADSMARGLYRPRALMQIGPQTSSLVSVVSVVPGWVQGYVQPNLIQAKLAGPVKSVTVSSGQGGDAIQCSGSYGRLVAYDAVNNLLADVPLTIPDPWDCGLDQVTYGARATATSSSAEIASFFILPMSPLGFPVLGMPGGRATATYVPQLTPDADPNEPPIARLQIVCVVTTFACTFDGSGSTDDHGIVSYSWDAGAGQAGRKSGKIASFTYPNGNVRMITLTVTDASGRSGSASQPFYFSFASQPGSNTPPVGAFNVVCPSLTCTFDSSPSTDDAGIVARGWNFGDGTGGGGSEAVIRHTYAAPGVYNVSLSVHDGGGTGSQTVKSITLGASGAIDLPPTSSFVWSCITPAMPHQCTLDAGGSSDDNGIVSYQWSWGNGRSETRVGKTAKNTWSGYGFYPVTLTVKDAKGQTGTSMQYVEVQ
ncbi:MAG TPA: PKD domain-containing protein [Gemmatimonadaceae bacterium]|nr:PKD domain-containing protein [Gemmatimonadaceae bacterium]